MQYIIGAFIIGIFVGICLGYGTLYQDLREEKLRYSKDLSILQDEVNYYRRNENIK